MRAIRLFSLLYLRKKEKIIMLKYQREIVGIDADTSSIGVGRFVIEDLKAFHNNVDISFVNLITVEDWDWEGLQRLKNECSVLVNPDERVLDILILNLNEVEVAEDEGFEEDIDTYTRGMGFHNISPYVGYETRYAYVNASKEIGKTVCYLSGQYDNKKTKV